MTCIPEYNVTIFQGETVLRSIDVEGGWVSGSTLAIGAEKPNGTPTLGASVAKTGGSTADLTFTALPTQSLGFYGYQLFEVVSGVRSLVLTGRIEVRKSFLS